MRGSSFDLNPIFTKRYDFFGYVMVNEVRFERVLSDETHRILTRILNHYVAANEPSRLTSMVEKIRDEIISNSNIYPIAWIYQPYQYAANFCQNELERFKSMLREVQEKAEDPQLVDYMRWLLEDPFVTVSLKVSEIKHATLERGLIIKEKVPVEDVVPVLDFSCKLIDPFDNFMWKSHANDDGLCEFKVIPVSDSKTGRSKYRIMTEAELIEFDPLTVQKIELVLASGRRQVNLISEGSDSGWFTVCPICKREMRKTTAVTCPICKSKVCKRCLIEEGFLKKRLICKSCKSKG